ncbi:hypothetical protein CHS0354_030530 [Potamilus streckersoni]|uniref:Uncharacterized protein n=1 Tax=Potamilus streckersoni TaxID=2493646 RepID=A0AAE0RPQ2_9BIVA|nr:hypothetical protein CHS0354_030530 [Potamilus streckersoni]
MYLTSRQGSKKVILVDYGSSRCIDEDLFIFLNTYASKRPFLPSVRDTLTIKMSEFCSNSSNDWTNVPIEDLRWFKSFQSPMRPNPAISITDCFISTPDR